MDIVNLTPEGFPIYGTKTVSYVSSDEQTLYMNVSAPSIMVPEGFDLDDLPDDLPPGTEAYLADDSGKWRKGADGTWETLVDPNNSSP